MLFPLLVSLSPCLARALATPLPCALRARRRRLARAVRVSAPATSHRIPDTQRSSRSRARCADSRRGDPPRSGPPRQAPRSRRYPSLRSPSGETPDPLARLFTRELADRLPDHLLETPDPIVNNIRDKRFEVVELLPGRGQLAPSLFVLRPGLLPPVMLRVPRGLHDLFLAGSPQLLEGGDAYVDRIAQRPRLGPGLGHSD